MEKWPGRLCPIDNATRTPRLAAERQPGRHFPWLTGGGDPIGAGDRDPCRHAGPEAGGMRIARPQRRGRKRDGPRAQRPAVRNSGPCKRES
jgi:hypothetical protein